MQLSELLQWLALGQKTGTLLIEGHGVQKRLYFQSGRINYTSSSDRREYLGQFLVSHGYITEEELKKAMEVHVHFLPVPRRVAEQGLDLAAHLFAEVTARPGQELEPRQR